MVNIKPTPNVMHTRRVFNFGGQSDVRDAHPCSATGCIMLLKTVCSNNIQVISVCFSWSRDIRSLWWKLTLLASTRCPSSMSCWMTLGNPVKGLALR